MGDSILQVKKDAISWRRRAARLCFARFEHRRFASLAALRWTAFAVVAAVIFVTPCLGSLQTARAEVANADPLSRGHYLVTSAGQCTDCHGGKFAGGPNPIPGPPGAPWAKTVPSLRGLHMFKTDADAVSFLKTAKLRNGKGALPPMPRYNFNTSDATAIVAYLRSLR